MSKNMAFGVDLGWVSQLEAQGIKWVDEKGNQIDPIEALMEMGVDSVRLRVFVNPPKEAYWEKREGETCMLGFADAQSVLEMSKRVKEKGLTLMIDFHYSDHFADPEFQEIPEAWKQDDNEGLKKRVYEHTKEVLSLLTQNGIYPEWVQVGNETNPGLLLPNGSRTEAPDVMVSFLNAGYEAVKECCPECQVITHVSGVDKVDWVVPFLEAFFGAGGKTDIIGFSHYPYWYKLVGQEEEVEDLQENLTIFSKKYQKPVMIVEVGGPEEEEKETYDLLCDTIEAVKNVPEHMGIGVYYWEPEVGKDLLPDHYPLGTAVLAGEKTLRFTKAMTAYKKYNK